LTFAIQRNMLHCDNIESARDERRHRRGEHGLRLAGETCAPFAA
jgi:hypothetical protein